MASSASYSLDEAWGGSQPFLPSPPSVEEMVSARAAAVVAAAAAATAAAAAPGAPSAESAVRHDLGAQDGAGVVAPQAASRDEPLTEEEETAAWRAAVLAEMRAARLESARQSQALLLVLAVQGMLLFLYLDRLKLATARRAPTPATGAATQAA